jgi:hypothetical protein
LNYELTNRRDGGGHVEDPRVDEFLGARVNTVDEYSLYLFAELPDVDVDNVDLTWGEHVVLIEGGWEPHRQGV